jgi:hypothetical protein
VIFLGRVFHCWLLGNADMEREEGVVYAMMGGAGGVMFGKLRKNWMGG